MLITAHNYKKSKLLFLLVYFQAISYILFVDYFLVPTKLPGFLVGTREIEFSELALSAKFDKVDG